MRIVLSLLKIDTSMFMNDNGQGADCQSKSTTGKTTESNPAYLIYGVTRLRILFQKSSRYPTGFLVAAQHVCENDLNQSTTKNEKTKEEQNRFSCQPNTNL
jgi:hypothetical protein